MDKSLIYLDFLVQDCAAEVWLNDIPLRMLDGKTQHQVSMPVPSYVVDGVNKLELVVLPGSIPSESRSGIRKLSPSDASARARLARYQDGALLDSEQGQVLVAVQWAADGMEHEFPVVVADLGDCGRNAGMWSWQKANIIDLARDRQRIMAVLGEIHAAFRDGDSTGLIGYCDTFLKEEAIAFPAYSVDELRARLMKDVGENAAKVDYVGALDPEQFDLRLCAKGRLVEAIDRRWQPIIAGSGPGGDEFPFPIFLGQLGGKFEILR
jgi:hypothetical protein